MNYSQKIYDLISRFKSLSEKQKYLVYSTIALLLLFTFYIYMQTPPKNFPLGKVITIQTGESLRSISENLFESKAIRSPFFFRLSVAIMGGEKKLMAGDYLLDEKTGPIDLAYRITQGRFHLYTFKATIPEGWNIFQIADYLDKNLIDFDKAKFIKISKNKEGYLFPDTYFISPAIKPEAIVEMMNNNFQRKIETISGISTSTHSLKEIITMASILEEEARTTESRKIVAGILWKRIFLGMPLQVDSTFSYINGKNTYDLTLDDLKIDSPYNTYKYVGLPPTPISNPGLDAIYSALNPTKTKYLYFLSSKSGKMYYATTFEEHVKNKQLYLNQ